MLHTVNKSPFEKTTLASCLSHTVEGAAVLLIEDGVYGALAGTCTAPLVEAASGHCKLYVLAADLDARGLSDTPLIEAFERVDYTGFVALAARYDKVQSWL